MVAAYLKGREVEMPLEPGKSDATVSQNVQQLRHEGYKPKQAVAIAMRKAGRPKSKTKGR